MFADELYSIWEAAGGNMDSMTIGSEYFESDGLIVDNEVLGNEDALLM